VHTPIVNSRTRRDAGQERSAPRARRTQAERRQHTRQALLDAALLQMEAGESFDALSLRSVARAAGVVPTAFYRYFASMDELGLALIEDSFRTLRGMLRHAREAGMPPERIINRSVEILIGYVRENQQHFAFVARIRSTGNGILRHAIRAEIRLFISELATDLGRFPILEQWDTDDLQMVAGLLVNTMIATIESLLETPVQSAETEAEITHTAEQQMRLIMLGVPHWRGSRARK
jgi:AcrR family transcriptional regulator